MNVHHLELFYYVAKFEGITAAVRKMPYGIQQPAVSGQLLQLEDSLGVKLFNRRPFTLTSAGEELYDHVYPFFARLEDVEEKLKGEESRHLRIATSSAVMQHHLPEVLADLRGDVPGLKLTLRDVEPSDVNSCIVSQQVDLAMCVINAQPSDDQRGGLRSVELLRLPLMLLLPKDHPAACFEDLLEEGNPEVPIPLVGLPKHESVAQIFQKGVEEKNLAWPVSVEVSSLDSVKHFVRNGFGAGLAVNVPEMKEPEGLKAIELIGFPPVIIGIVYQGALKPVAEMFLSTAEERANELKSRFPNG